MKPEFLHLAQLRAEWRSLHQKGDHLGAVKTLSHASLQSPPVEPSPLPPKLKKKLQEFGREWEYKIAEVAAHDQASFFCLTISIRIDVTTPVHQAIERKLNEPEPWGVLLFCEADLPSPIVDKMWRGIYYFTILQHRKPSDLQLESLAGVIHVGPVTNL